VFDGIRRLDPGHPPCNLSDQLQDLLDNLFVHRIAPRSLADARACAPIMNEEHWHGEVLTFMY
jgi:hypothetical protein